MGHEAVRLMFPIHLEKACFTPGGRPVLADIDLEIDADGITVVLGPNGAGKTLLLRMLAGLQVPHAGRIAWNGAATPPAGIAMVFQHPILMRTSVFANGALGLIPLGLSRAQTRRRTERVLARVGLADRAADSARLLSGGERQRLALARAWAMEPTLLLLDEPTAALDPTATEAVEQIVREMRTEGVRIIMTTHNLGQALRISDDIIFVAGGYIRERAPAARFFSRPESAEARLFIQKELPWRIPFDT
jgi:tungstate transport system ATP-binding protein